MIIVSNQDKICERVTKKEKWNIINISEQKLLIAKCFTSNKDIFINRQSW